MIFYFVLWFYVLFLIKITYGETSGVTGEEHMQLDRNLKVLRKDFNNLIENLEDFAGDFLVQMRDAGKLVENTYGSEDYNWQDDGANSISKMSEKTHSSLTTTTEYPKTISTSPSLYSQKDPNKITKKAFPKETKNRRTRSTHLTSKNPNIRSPDTIIQEERKRVPASMIQEEGKRMPTPIIQEEGKRMPVLINQEEVKRMPAPIIQKERKIMSAPIIPEEGKRMPVSMPEKVEQRNAQVFPPFTDNSINIRGDIQEGENVLQAKQSGQDEIKADRKFSFLPNEKTENPLICTGKSQQEIDLEKQKMEELKMEVQKLTELASLLKDQQKLIKMLNDEDKYLENNEIVDKTGNSKGDGTNSFLYRTLKKLQNDRGSRGGNFNNNLKEPTSNVQGGALELNKEITKIQSPTFAELEKIKFDLNNTAEALNKTKEVLIKERQKEEVIERELKRQNSELKFLKVMTENLYDKMGHKTNDGKSEYKIDEKPSKTSRNNDFEDVDIDSILEAIHTPKTMPLHKPLENRHSATKGLPKVHLSPSTRENTNEDTKMRKFLALLNQEKSKNGNNIKYSANDTERSTLENLENTFSIENNTILPMNARASNSDVELKLKLLQLLAERDSSSKQKVLNEAVEKLLAPEKKSDDDQLALDTLTALIKDTRGGISHQQSNKMENLKKLLRELNGKPQKKSDDTDVESELKELQKAINGLRPKEDILLDNIDLNSIGNNRKGKQEGDTLSVLSQLIAQNGGAASTQTGIDLGGVGSNLAVDSRPDVQQLLKQIMSTSNVGYNGPNGNGNANKNTLLNNYGSPLYANAQSNYGPGGATSYSGSPNPYIYSPNSNLYGSNLNSYEFDTNPYYSNANAYNPNYGSGTNSYSPNALAYTPNSNVNGANLHSYSPSINSYHSSLNPFNPSLYGPKSNLYGANYVNSNAPSSYSAGPYPNIFFGSPGSNGYNFNNLGYNGDEYHAPKGYNFLAPRPYSNNNYNSQHYPQYVLPNLHSYNTPFPNSYSSNYPASSYSSGVSGSHATGNQVSTGYQNGPGYGKNGYNKVKGNNAPIYGSGVYAPQAASYQNSANGYSGVSKENKAVYGSPVQKNEAGTHQSYGMQFFPISGPSGGTHQENSYSSKDYVGPSVDQSYGNGQTGDQYKHAMASDLAKQIESLESAITGLNKGDYTQTPEDKAAVASLEQRIYELKGVISSLNKQSYGAPQPSYLENQPSYGPSDQKQGLYKPQSASPTLYKGALSQTGGELNSYGSPSQTPYQNSASNTQIQAAYDHNPAPEQSYGAGSHPPTTYTADSSISQSEQGSQPTNSNYRPAEANQQFIPTPPYPASSQLDTHLSPSASGNSYQPKRASEDDGNMSQGMPKELQRLTGKRKLKSRRKRQTNGIMPPEIVPEIPAQVVGDDISINVRQSEGGQDDRDVQYAFGNDALTRVANTFKKYLEENLAENPITNQPESNRLAANQETKNNALDDLNAKLDGLKHQLDSRVSSGRSFSDVFGAPGIAHDLSSGVTYGSKNNYLYNQYQKPGITSLKPTLAAKKQDIFTQIVLIILKKVLGSLDSVIPALFGNLVSTVGNSYGDYYSPLQNLVRNLGFIGYIPLILVKILESVGTTIQYLGKNHFFKKFLLPAAAVAAAGLFILFLVYFYQQDEPYGYIGYQENSYHNKYPKFEANTYGDKGYGGTDNSNSIYSYYPNHRSNVEQYGDGNGNIYGNNYIKPNFGRYIRPDFDGTIMENFNDNEGSAPAQYYRGYYDYFSDNFKHT